MNLPAELVVELVQLFSKQKFNGLINEVDNLLDDYHNSYQLWNLPDSFHLGLENLMIKFAIMTYQLI